MKTVGNFIDNEQVTPVNENMIPLFNPALGKQVGQVALSSQEDTQKAIESSSNALNEWSSTPPLKRARILFRFKELLEKNKDRLAEIITQEHGKVFSDAQGEMTRGIEVVEFSCGIPHLLKGEHSSNVGTGVDSHSLMKPVGVCAGITPFNFPAMVPMWMFPVAIACGNTFILKPSEKDPSVSMEIALLLKEAGLPKGVFNIINGNKEAVDTLLKDRNIQAVSFVGSTPIAEYIYKTASQHGKRVQALGGAKNHMVIMPDADLDQAVSGLMGAAYGSAGERCMAISAAIAVGDIGDALIEKLIPKVNGLKIGPGLDKKLNPDMGPLISKEHLEKVKSYVEQGIKEEASLVCDGRDLSSQEGYFLGGCLFDHVKEGMKIHKEEIFGPVLVVLRVPTYQDAVQIINNHEYGNGTAIFTRDGDCARQFTEDIQVGMVGINVPIPVPMAFHSFGGWKRSLFGPLHVHGADGVRFYTKMKTITSRWPSGIRKGTNFSMPTMK
ncbi:MAG: CoA-acylating methylmalonate-semialdehyde dehydrogenase [Bdellovibrionota bacterium]|nr:CoA-acylating methylmalonate-semialdehyde dehydrogenase [Bdellovibrionota bacterium]